MWNCRGAGCWEAQGGLRNIGDGGSGKFGGRHTPNNNDVVQIRQAPTLYFFPPSGAIDDEEQQRIYIIVHGQQRLRAGAVRVGGQQAIGVWCGGKGDRADTSSTGNARAG